jgi:hypothetical protein
MCDCISYNRPDICPETGTRSVILPKPEWSSREKGICVDACIAEAIKMLWANGVVTTGCCCGHNRAKPSVVIETGNDCLEAIRLLKENDGREWEVLQWRICVIGPDGKGVEMPIVQFALTPVIS